MNIEIANRLITLRKEKGYTQESLADALGISRQAVSKWERAEASPDTDNLILLAKLYGVSLDELLKTDASEEEIKQISKDKEEDDEDDALTDKEKATRKMVDGSISSIIGIIYLILGFAFNLWHPGWILFLLIPVLTSIVETVLFKDFNKFCYPVFVTIIYLFIGFTFNSWHPWWFVFCTIPAYYAIFGSIKNFKKKENKYFLD